MVDYGKWDKFAAALDDASVERCPPAPPWVADDTGGGDGTDPTDPTRVAAMRNLLDEIDDARRPHLEAAIGWLERASACFAHGEAPSDGDCPFNQGDEAWFWFCLLANKPHVTLHGPYRPLLARHRSAKEQCFAEGLVCARCFAAGGGHYWGRRPLKRCSACRAASYCGRDCQRLDLDAHKADCRRGAARLAAARRATAARRLAGQEKRATCPTSKAHISAVFHSFRLIFGRAIIFRNGLEAWMFFRNARARNTHVEATLNHPCAAQATTGPRRATRTSPKR